MSEIITLSKKLKKFVDIVGIEMRDLYKTIRSVYGGSIQYIVFKDTCNIGWYHCIDFKYRGNEYRIAFVLPSLRIFVFDGKDVIFKSMKLQKDGRLAPSKAKEAVKQVFRFLEEKVFI